jgi:hypothetical protein
LIRIKRKGEWFGKSFYVFYFYFTLGSLSFLDPWLIHEAREWLGLFDAIALFVFMLRVLSLIMGAPASDVAVQT